ncbi:uncharacterized protein K489DRAFT_108944 [Dissoconium aciculare CBS 342.82]|jgi:hypothetical protein|uniref:Integral membrane protein n=1 Tax=Dissoconium aciculare CBS 342.82 TaxID=1314786 RepID=A0A6J3MEY0_9PEZI|nr:uncharacterized protein K489DRAFT_108944 [Dissoconium aciculare CBS 342.82]KAF1826184.1 hypothetical protein K489DRAFT_108944 [Dissoconium aciculare CBS 342.82]
MMALSSNSYLPIAAGVFATIFIGFGINAAVNPQSALTFFELQYPTPTSIKDRELLSKVKLALDALSVVYGVRDVFIGAALYATALYGSKEALGWICVAAGLTAGVDGAVCKFMVGKGEMNHWGYAPMVVILGSLLLGAADGTPLESLMTRN